MRQKERTMQMKGAIIGDIIGSAYEFYNVKTKDFPLFCEESRFTDDTVMTCASAKALMSPERDVSQVMREVGRRYPACGYGRYFFDWMFTDGAEPYGSFGNGAAMRVSAAGELAVSVEDAKRLSRKITEVSHDHPEGIKGAECIAVCIYLARTGSSKEVLYRYVTENYYPLTLSCADYASQNVSHGQEICQVSVPQALECFFESKDYEDCIRTCVSTGGDSDTVAAIAGAVAEAYYGVPEELWAEAEKRVDGYLLSIIEDFESFGRKEENG